jgi:hypothetical protein
MYSPEFQAGETKIVGRAFTVKFVPQSDEASPKLQGNYVSSETHQAKKYTNNLSRLIKSPLAV